MNIAMEQTQEYVDGQHKNTYADTFIRGNNGIPRLFLVSYSVSIVHQDRKVNKLSSLGSEGSQHGRNKRYLSVLKYMCVGGPHSSSLVVTFYIPSSFLLS